MRFPKNKQGELLALIRGGEAPSRWNLVRLVVSFSLPAILAQLSSILMQCIDASMVGSLGANATASIGLVSTTIWLFGGLCSSAAAGFSVQVAHLVGAGKNDEASGVLRQSILVTGALSLTLMVVGMILSRSLPVWLGGAADIVDHSSRYFFLYALFLPILQMSFLSGSMLRCSGNMLVPGLLNVMMCLMDVVFNFFFIFPSREVSFLQTTLWMPGLGLGVEGAAWGTAMAELITASCMMWFLCVRSKDLGLRLHPASFRVTRECLEKAITIGLPMAVEHTVMCGAQIVSTIIVAPLGTIAVAANSLGITAESLCYMPGYGIGDAATTLVGQSLGGARQDLAKRFAKITIALGMSVMTLLGVVMYVFAPEFFSLLTPDVNVQILGADVLRIEAFAEPMFAASIVVYDIFVGAGDTFKPCLMNLGSMWLVRITLAALLAPVMGLKGVWLAMCIELCFRGAIFLLRMKLSGKKIFG